MIMNMQIQKHDPQKLLELLEWILQGSERSHDSPKVSPELEYIAAPFERRRIKSNKLEEQVEVLKKMQALEQSSSLAVSRNFARGKIQITGLTVPAGEISGDGYDVFTDSTGAVWICMADTCGKGLAPGFFSQHVLSSIRRHANTITDAYHRNSRTIGNSESIKREERNPESLPAIALHSAGEEISALKTALFCDAIAIRITPSGECSWSSAGIKPNLVDLNGRYIQPEDRQITLSGWPPNSGIDGWNKDISPLNLIPEKPFQVSRCAGQLQDEDRIYILSDGITDRWNDGLDPALQWCSKKIPSICPAILCGTAGNLRIPHNRNSNHFSYFNERDDMTAICIVWNE